MLIRLLAAAALALTVSLPAQANTTMVACTGYVVSMSDDIAIRGQVMAGSLAAFEKTVCEHSEAEADFDGSPRTIPVFIEALNVSTRVTIFPVSDD
ncbi:MAG: hypothetical protein AAF646_00395 [Pseudomonadota bacterium]